MIPFVDIRTMYGDCSSLNIEELSQVYDNKELLESTIRQLIFSHIEKESILGKRILLKPNWVCHNSHKDDIICLCTHENFILAVLKILLEWSPKCIVIGDAPVQVCKWDKLLSEKFLSQIQSLSVKYTVPIQIVDFRRVKLDMKNNILSHQNSGNDYLIFDVGTRSHLEAITDKKKRFRVTCYNPDRLAEAHHHGVHKYCITKTLFDSDVVITLPKIKTHQKAGLTNSLKILVGINGDKDYLPHHRIGAQGHGGDCYKGWHPFRSISENILDEANRHIGKRIYKPLLHLSALFWRLSLPTPAQNTAAGWYGNDTVWRMVLDLNMIALYGKKDGTLSDKPQRQLFTLCDGIVAGQGNGPLSPEPLALGVIGFSNDAYAMDEVAGILMGLEISKIPLLKAASTYNQEREIQYSLNGHECKKHEYATISVAAKMPPGWINYHRL